MRKRRQRIPFDTVVFQESVLQVMVAANAAELLVLLKVENGATCFRSSYTRRLTVT